MTHCVKNVSIRSYSGPNAAKIQTRISPNTGAFYAVDDKLETLISNIFQGLIKKMREYLKHLFQKKLVAIYFALSHCFLKHNWFLLAERLPLETHLNRVFYKCSFYMNPLAKKARI